LDMEKQFLKKTNISLQFCFPIIFKQWMVINCLSHSQKAYFSIGISALDNKIFEFGRHFKLEGQTFSLDVESLLLGSMNLAKLWLGKSRLEYLILMLWNQIARPHLLVLSQIDELSMYSFQNCNV
jgi:hypothetical protein